MNLEQYIVEKGLSVREAAAELGYGYEAVRLWMRGERVPRPEAMSRITSWSDGQVTAADLYAAWAIRKRESAPRRVERNMNDAGADAAYRGRVLAATPAAS